MIHLKRLTFGVGIMTLTAAILTLIAASFWVTQVLFITVFPNHPVQLGVVIFILLSYCVGVVVELVTGKVS